MPDALPAERRLLRTLTGIHFTHLTDFMVLMPMAPHFMSAFGLSLAQVGLLVFAYSAAAGAAGLMAGLVADRFDRRRYLASLYAGFIVAGLLSAAAPSFATLLTARVAAGACGGLIGSTIQAVIADLVPEARRAGALGQVMAAHSLAAVAGLPAGLALAAWAGWRTPFLALAVLSVLLLVVMLRALPPVTAHLTARSAANLLGHLAAVLADRRHLTGFLLTASLAFSAFLVVAYAAPFWVRNVGVPEQHLSLIFLVAGICTFFTSPWIGRLADRHGRRPVLAVATLLSITAILLFTRTQALPLWQAALLAAWLYVLIYGRFVPAMALVAGVPLPAQRGAFMSLNAATMQLSMGVASLAGGTLMGQGPDGRITGFEIVGYLAAGVSAAVLLVARRMAEGRTDIQSSD